MYIDPSGERQGPFGGHDMATWFLVRCAASPATHLPRFGQTAPRLMCARPAGPQGGYMEDRELKVASATAREPGDADFAPLAVLLQPKQADVVLHAASP